MNVPNPEELTYRSSVWSSVGMTVVSLFMIGFLVVIARALFQTGTSWYQSIPIIIPIAFLALFAFLLIRDVFMGIRSVSLSPSTIEIRYLTSRSVYQLSELRELSIRKYSQSVRGRQIEAWRITFVGADDSRHYFALNGQQGEQIASRLKQHIEK